MNTNPRTPAEEATYQLAEAAHDLIALIAEAAAAQAAAVYRDLDPAPAKAHARQADKLRLIRDRVQAARMILHKSPPAIVIRIDTKDGTVQAIHSDSPYPIKFYAFNTDERQVGKAAIRQITNVISADTAQTYATQTAAARQESDEKGNSHQEPRETSTYLAELERAHRIVYAPRQLCGEEARDTDSDLDYTDHDSATLPSYSEAMQPISAE